MAEVSNQKILERYKDLLANRTHDVIVRDLALDVLEEELRDVKDEKQKIAEENETLKRDVGRANEAVRRLQDELNKTNPPVIQGEIVERESD